jgi:hypothetical protein
MVAIQIPATVRIIGISAFEKCLNLASVEFRGESQLEIIENCAFQDTAIDNFTLPLTVHRIKNRAFANCRSCRVFTIAKTCSLKEIDAGAFRDSGITGITIPEQLCTIGEEAFQDCADLAEANFTYPSSLLAIGSRAFWRCSLLIIAIHARRLMTIGAEAFAGCQNLEMIAIVGNEELEIGDGAFSGCAICYIQIPSWLRMEKIEELGQTPGEFVGSLNRGRNAFRGAFGNCASINVDWIGSID